MAEAGSWRCRRWWHWPADVQTPLQHYVTIHQLSCPALSQHLRAPVNSRYSLIPAKSCFGSVSSILSTKVKKENKIAIIVSQGIQYRIIRTTHRITGWYNLLLQSANQNILSCVLDVHWSVIILTYRLNNNLPKLKTRFYLVYIICRRIFLSRFAKNL